MSWEGLHGPQRRTIGDRIVIGYRNNLYVDYIDMPGTMTAALTAPIGAAEHKPASLHWLQSIGACVFALVGAKR
jgi:hypothetical protein